jgi:PAS domain S-box-containing protein
MSNVMNNDLLSEIRLNIAERLLKLTLPILGIIFLITIVLILKVFPSEMMIIHLSSFGLIATSSIFFIWKVKKNTELAIRILLGVCIIMIVAGMLFGGGIRSPVFSGTYACLLAIVMLYGFWVGSLFFGIMCAFSILVVLLENAGIITTIVSLPIFFILINSIVWLLILAVCFSIPVKLLLSALKSNESEKLNTLNAHRAQQQSQEAFRAVFDQTFQFMALLDLEGFFIEANNTVLNYIELTIEQIRGKTLANFGIWNESEAFEVEFAIKEALAGKKYRFMIIKNFFGHEERVIDFCISPYRNNAGDIAYLILEGHDITDLRKVAAELSLQQRRYEAIVSNATDAIFLLNHRLIIDCNKKAIEMFGYTLKELLGKNPLLFAPENQPDGRFSVKRADEKICAAMDGHAPVFEWLSCKIDGSEFFTEVSLKNITCEGEENQLVIIRDISNRKKMEEKLRHSQKMESVGLLAGGVAHDFNNMLSGIIGAADLLKLEVSNQEQLAYINIIMDSGRRAADLTNRLLAFSRKDENAEQEPVDLHQAVDSAVLILKRSLDKKINIVSNLSAKHSVIMGDVVLMQNVIINLGINAGHAMADGGKLTIESHNIVLDKDYCQSVPFSIVEGNYIEVQISDTGCGIAPEHIHKVFEPFFTTKKRGNGTGLGLSIVYGTVRQFNGMITVYSEIGKGTVFTICLPLLTGEFDLKSNTDIALMGSGKILIVDDEDFVRTTAAMILKSLGYETIIAESAPDALEIFSRDCQLIDLVLLDSIMPVMGGEECFLQMRKIRPDMKIILCSGFSSEETIEKMKTCNVDGFLRKPYTRGEISRVISSVMGRKD